MALSLRTCLGLVGGFAGSLFIHSGVVVAEQRCVHGGESDAGCAVEETGLLQVSSVPLAMHVDLPEPAETVIDMRGSSSDECSPGIKIDISKIKLPADTKLSYGLPALTGNSHCDPPAKGAPGPTSCCGGWDDDATLEYKLQTDEIPTREWMASVKATIQANIFWSWSEVGSVEIRCAICGANCTIPEIVLAHLVTIKSREVEMPACPPNASEFSGAIGLMLPEGVSVPMSVRGSADIQLQKPGGDAVAFAHVVAELHPPR